MQQLGVERHCAGEAGYTTLERRWARPTCDINGLTSGYQGEGAKTVLPARASAKFSFRLVPNQDPHEDCRQSLQQVSRSARCRRASGWNWSIITVRRAWSCRSKVRTFGRPPRRSKPASAGRRCSSAKAARFPIVNTFARELGADVLLVGLGPERRQHAQPERKIFARRLPPRHRWPAPPVARTGKTHAATRINHRRTDDRSHLTVPQ